jgi:hypothetical protein
MEQQAEEAAMSEQTGSFVGVIVFAVICGVLAYYFQFRTGYPIDIVLAVAAVVFCVLLLLKLKVGLIGINLILLASITVYFIRTWMQPILNEDPSLIWPNVLKMLGGILLFIYIGRQRIEHSFF